MRSEFVLGEFAELIGNAPHVGQRNGRVADGRAPKASADSTTASIPPNLSIVISCPDWRRETTTRSIGCSSSGKSFITIRSRRLLPPGGWRTVRDL